MLTAGAISVRLVQSRLRIKVVVHRSGGSDRWSEYCCKKGRTLGTGGGGESAQAFPTRLGHDHSNMNGNSHDVSAMTVRKRRIVDERPRKKLFCFGRADKVATMIRRNGKPALEWYIPWCESFTADVGLAGDCCFWLPLLFASCIKFVSFSLISLSLKHPI